MLCSICRPSRRFLKTSSWYTLITSRRIGRRFWKNPRGFSVFFQQDSCSPTLRYNYLNFFFFDFVFSKGFLENIHIAANPLGWSVKTPSGSFMYLRTCKCRLFIQNIECIYLFIYFEHVWNGVKVHEECHSHAKKKMWLSILKKAERSKHFVISTPCFSWVI